MTRTAVMSFSESVTASTESIYLDESPFTGKINQITVGFLNGCANLVGISIQIGGKDIVPYTGYVYGNNATYTFDLGVDIGIREAVRLTIRNEDILFAHKLSVTLNISGPDREPSGGA